MIKNPGLKLQLTKVLLAVFTLNNHEVANAGGIFEVAGDVFSGGGNARQRDFDACEATKKEQTTKLSFHIVELQGQVNVLMTKSSGISALIIQAQQELLQIKNEQEPIDKLVQAFSLIEDQNGANEALLDKLNILMTNRRQDKGNIIAWKTQLTQLSQKLKSPQKLVAANLIQQMTIAAASDNQRVINSFISVMTSSSRSKLSDIKSAWITLKSMNDTRVNELNSFCGQRTSEINSNAAAITNLKSQVSVTEQTRYQISSRGC